MGNKKRIFIIAGIFLILGFFVILFWPIGEPVPPPPPPPEEKVAAVVNGEEILRADFKSQLEAEEYFWTTVYPELTEATASEQLLKNLPKIILDNKIQEALLRQYLTKKGIEITDGEARDYIRKNIVDEKYEENWQAYEEFLVERKSTLNNILASVKRDLMTEKVIETENLKRDEFENWYFNLRDAADIDIYIDL